MSFVLVVEPEERFGERIEEVLGAEGWQTRRVSTRNEALGVAAAQAPTLVIVNAELADAEDLFRSFSRRYGGPGALALLPEEQAKTVDPASVGADALLGKPFTPQDLGFAVRSCLAADRESRPSREGGQLSSQDIFGDVLAEIEQESPESAPRAKSAPRGDVSQRLEETLAGVMPTKAGRPRQAAKAPSSEVDALLDKTLSDLRMGSRSGAGDAVAPRAVKPPASPPAGTRKTAKSEPGADFGQYTLEERIAVGGMAEVWKARMKGFEGFQKTVAIKKILPHLTSSEDFVTMFIDEAKLAAQLNHNNIIQIYDLGKADGEYYIAMEFVEGRDLRAILRTARRRNTAMPEPLALLVAARLADALDYAHRKRDFDDRDLGLVHRDISPQNVLISQEGEIKLCDFGIAKAVSKVGQTQMGALKGKIQYMSPEQAWGREVDARSDIFSLGVLLFEMLTGQVLFEGETEVSVLEAVRECRLRDPRALNSSITDGAARVLEKALRKDPAARYRSAREILEEISSILLAMDHAANRVDLARWIDRIFREAAAAEAAPAAAPASSQGIGGAPGSGPRSREGTAAGSPSGQAGQASGVPGGASSPAEGVSEAPSPLAALRARDARDEGTLGGEAPPPVEMLDPEEMEALSPVGGVEPRSGVERGGRGRAALLAGIGLVAVAAVVGFFTLRPKGAPAETPTTGVEERSAVTPVGEPLAEESTGEVEGAGVGEVPAEGADGLTPATDPGAEGVLGASTTGPARDADPRVTPPDEPPPVPIEAAASPPQDRVVTEPVRQGGRESIPAAASGARPEATAADTADAARGAAANAREPALQPGSAAAGAGVATPTPAAGSMDPGPVSTEAQVPQGGAGQGAEVPPVGADPGLEVASPVSGEPVSGEPEPTTAQPAAELAAEAAPVEPEVQVGDLVEPGAGVVPPVLVSFDKPKYPPMARKLAVQGTVVVSVLVDENGRPVDWKLIRQISQKVGINEAVLEAVKEARWDPATKDGVKVKMWTSVVVPFKM